MVEKQAATYIKDNLILCPKDALKRFKNAARTDNEILVNVMATRLLTFSVELQKAVQAGEITGSPEQIAELRAKLKRCSTLDEMEVTP